METVTNPNIITSNSELITAIVTIVVGAIVRLIEKRKLKKKHKIEIENISAINKSSVN